MGSSPGPALAGLTATHKINENQKNKKSGSPGGTRTPDPALAGLTATRKINENQKTKKSGSPGGTRTPDQVVNSHPLYRLSILL